MNNVSPIEAFIKKYRSAQSSNSKELRISMNEATDIIAAFATLNTDTDEFKDLMKQVVTELQKLSGGVVQDGGGFK